MIYQNIYQGHLYNFDISNVHMVVPYSNTVPRPSSIIIISFGNVVFSINVLWKAGIRLKLGKWYVHQCTGIAAIAKTLK